MSRNLSEAAPPRFWSILIKFYWKWKEICLRQPRASAPKPGWTAGGSQPGSQPASLSFSIRIELKFNWNLHWGASEQFPFYFQLEFNVRFLRICFGLPQPVSVYLQFDMQLESVLGCLRSVSFHFQIEFNSNSIRICSGLPHCDWFSIKF